MCGFQQQTDPIKFQQSYSSAEPHGVLKQTTAGLQAYNGWHDQSSMDNTLHVQLHGGMQATGISQHMQVQSHCLSSG